MKAILFAVVLYTVACGTVQATTVLPSGPHSHEDFAQQPFDPSPGEPVQLAQLSPEEMRETKGAWGP